MTLRKIGALAIYKNSLVNIVFDKKQQFDYFCSIV